MEGIVPISSLDESKKNSVIGAKLLKKTINHSYYNKKHKRTCFFDSLHLQDESGRITAVNYKDYNRDILKKLEEGKFYKISGFHVESQDRECFIFIHPYKMVFDCLIYEEYTGHMNVPKLEYSYKTVQDIVNLQPHPERLDQFVDFKGLCLKAEPLTEPRGLGDKVSKTLILRDAEGQSIPVAYWCTEGENLSNTEGLFITLKDAKVKENVGEKTLSVVPSTLVKILKKEEN